MTTQYLKAFYIAGFAYYQGAYAYPELHIGTRLKLVREASNIHDENAIALYYQEQKLGFVPRAENSEIAKVIDAGYDIFEGVVQQLTPSAAPASQVRVALHIKPASKVSVTQNSTQ
ncbi:MAG: HIRAN domain-containing protein [Burkholderiales bacterium]|jgi:hypothetical protein|nr:HIRAN domain-containing protein [Burkholderiales bacterium]